jgi:hypothetical protein
MRQQPDTVIRWAGLPPPIGTTSPDELHGLALRVEWEGYSHEDGLIGLARRLGCVDVDARSVEDRLREAVERRTRELTLPNGCVVVPPRIGIARSAAMRLPPSRSPHVRITWCGWRPEHPVLHGTLEARRFSLLVPWGSGTRPSRRVLA